MLTLLADLIIALAIATGVYIWTQYQSKRDAQNPYGGCDYNDLDGPYPDDYDYDEEVILYDGDTYQVIEHAVYGRYATSPEGIGSEDNILDDFGYEPRELVHPIHGRIDQEVPF